MPSAAKSRKRCGPEAAWLKPCPAQIPFMKHAVAKPSNQSTVIPAWLSCPAPERRACSLEPRFCRVVPASVAHIQTARRFHLDLDPAEAGVGKLLRGVIRQQILGAQLVADFVEGVVELGERVRVIILAASVLGELNQSVLSA